KKFQTALNLHSSCHCLADILSIGLSYFLHQRLLWLIEVFNKSAIWGHSSTIRVGSKNRRIPRGNDHVGPGQAKILNNIVQERPLLAKVKFSGQRNGFSTEANHPKPRLSDD